MPRRFGLLLLGAAIALAAPVYAGEWKEQSYHDSKIEFRTDWDWASPEKGKYWETWTDNYHLRLYLVSWGDASHRLEIKLSVLGPNILWRKINKIDKESLISWRVLKSWGVSEIRELPCGAKNCVTFRASKTLYCAAFRDWKGSDVYLIEGDQRPDIVRGYYCHGTSNEVTTEMMNNILASIFISKKTHLKLANHWWRLQKIKKIRQLFQKQQWWTMSLLRTDYAKLNPYYQTV